MTDKKTDYEHKTVDTEGLYEEEHEGKLTLFTPELLARDFAYIAAVSYTHLTLPTTPYV